MRQKQLMSTSSGYTCSSCTKTYTYKYNYDRHVACCEFFNKTLLQHQHEIDAVESTPDIHSLYQLVKELAVRVTKVEKENAQLKQQLSKRCKVNIMEWLNKLPVDKQPSQLFTDWVRHSVLTNVHLQLEGVYSNDLVSGIISTWKTALSASDGEVPLKAFETRANTFYVYDKNADGSPTWTILTSAAFDIQLRMVCRQFVVDFKKYWYDKNEDKINEDETWTNMYVDYYQKILGGSRTTTEGICQKVRQQLYVIMKQAFTHAVEIDFS